MMAKMEMENKERLGHKENNTIVTTKQELSVPKVSQRNDIFCSLRSLKTVCIWNPPRQHNEYNSQTELTFQFFPLNVFCSTARCFINSRYPQK